LGRVFWEEYTAGERQEFSNQGHNMYSRISQWKELVDSGTDDRKNNTQEPHS
jgi:hypothetical protein